MTVRLIVSSSLKFPPVGFYEKHLEQSPAERMDTAALVSESFNESQLFTVHRLYLVFYSFVETD